MDGWMDVHSYNPPTISTNIHSECDCERSVQDETHVVFGCEKTDGIRGRYGINRGVYNSIGEMMDRHDASQLVDFVDECMKMY